MGKKRATKNKGKGATGKQKSISHPRTMGKREKGKAEEEVESRGVCCKMRGKERERN